MPAPLAWAVPVVGALVLAAGLRAGRSFAAVPVVAALGLLVLFAASAQWAGAAVQGAVA